MAEVGLQSYTEQSGQLPSADGVGQDIVAFAGVFKRGPINRALVVDEDGFRRRYGGIYGDEHGPLHVDGFFRNRKLRRPDDTSLVAICREVGTGYAHASLALPDMLGAQTLMLLGRYPGKYGDAVSVRNLKYSGTTKASTNNGAGTLDDTKKELALDDVSKAEIGDVFKVVDSSGNWRVGVVSAVDAAKKDVKFFTKAGWGSGTVAVGATYLCATTHGARTKLKAALAPNAVAAQLESGQNVKKGTILAVIHGGDGQANEPAFIVPTEVIDDTATIPAFDGAITYPIGSIVVSIDWSIVVTERAGVREENIGALSLVAASDNYVGTKLGQGISLSVGAALAGTTKAAAGGAINSGATSVELATGVGATLTVRKWYQFGPDGGPKVLRQIKAINGDVVSFDSVGVLAAPVANTAAIKPVEITVLDPDQNPSRSELVLAQEMNAAGIGDSATTLEGLRIPAPFESLTLSGGSDGAAPTGVSQVIGTDVGGVRTGLYTLDALIEKDRIVAIAIPALDASSSSSRALIDVAAKDFARDRGIQFVSNTPGDLSMPDDAVPYRFNTLGIDSRYVELNGPWGYARHPDGSGRRVRTTLEGFILGAIMRRISEGGAHEPGFNEVLDGIVGVDMEIRASMADRWRDAGINACVREDQRGIVVMGGRTLFLNVADAKGRHHANVARWLNYVRRSLKAIGAPYRSRGLTDQLLTKAEESAKKFFSREFAKGAMEPANEADAFYVKTRRQQVNGVNQLLFIYGAVPTKATEAVAFEANLFDGSVREVA